MGKRTLLFYGELPPNAIHGVAYANQINLNNLRNYFEIDIVEEKSILSEHYLVRLKKPINVLRDLFLIGYKSIRNTYDYFYLTLSISSLGCTKTLLSIVSFKIFNSGNVILHIHRGDFIKWYRKSLINQLLASLVIKLSKKIIVLSESQKKEFDQTFKRKCCVLHNTVEQENSQGLPEKQGKRFLYISNYLSEKGIFDLLVVFAKLTLKYKDITLYTYGAFPSQQIKDRVMRFSSPNIIIGDIIVGKEKFTEIISSDCLILPSLNEGQPLVLLEAMSVGTPVISTRVGLIPEMLGDEYPFLSYPGDIESLEEKMIQFINYRDTASISKTLMSRYYEKYSHKIHSENLLSIFN